MAGPDDVLPEEEHGEGEEKEAKEEPHRVVGSWLRVEPEREVEVTGFGQQEMAPLVRELAVEVRDHKLDGLAQRDLGRGTDVRREADVDGLGLGLSLEVLDGDTVDQRDGGLHHVTAVLALEIGSLQPELLEVHHLESGVLGPVDEGGEIENQQQQKPACHFHSDLFIKE